MEILELENLRIEVERRNVKTARLTVYPDGGVKIAAPQKLPLEHIKQFAASKKTWIQGRLERFSRKVNLSVNSLGTNIQHIWGIPCPFTLIERRGAPKIVISQGTMTYYVRPGGTEAKRLEYLGAWYRGILKEAAAPLAEKWAGRLGVKIRDIYVREMKSYWGSCNPDRGTIRLNTKLAKLPPQFLEYVIIHELVHLLEPRHNRNFYRVMTELLPDWKVIRKNLNRGTWG